MAIRLRLERGTIYLTTAAAGPRRGPLTIETQLGRVRNVRTAYELRLTRDRLEVAVREGVEIVPNRGAGSRRIDVAAGELVTLVSGGEVVRGAIERHHPRWSWAEEVAEPFVADGRTLGDLLGWVSAETGLEVRYLTGERVDGTVLRGDVVWPAPHSAIDPALRLCGLSGEIRDGVLEVRPAAR